MRTSVYFILPEEGNTFNDQLLNCFKQLEQLSGDTASSGIVALTFFIRAESNQQYRDYKENVFSAVQSQYKGMQPAVACVAQAPENGNYLGLEVFLEHNITGKAIYKQIEEVPYVVIEHKDFKEVYVLGLTGIIKGDVYENSNSAFSLMEKILASENMDFSDVVRQWNYIENITHIPDMNRNFQHYQIFNDVRSKYYSKANFKNGYPSATGIGSDEGGVIINFIALAGKSKVQISPLMNPGQIDAHKYSQKVLVGKGVFVEDEKSCPKFERGKIVSIPNNYKIYISGTASIIGEETVHPTDVEKQTVTTINNIKNLTKPENLSEYSVVRPAEEFEYSYVRAYVKHKKDIDIVKITCEKHFRSKCFQYLVADICRSDLLVEIEALIES